MTKLNLQKINYDVILVTSS